MLLGANKEKIEVFLLPPYSPESNPKEYVNQDVKTNIIGNKRPVNKEQMKLSVENFMPERKMIKRNPIARVQKYFHEKHVRYAA